MFKGTISTMNELIANEVMSQIEGLTLWQCDGDWGWTYKGINSECYYESPLEAFINFTKGFLKDS